jgi:hypothetical protein
VELRYFQVPHFKRMKPSIKKLIEADYEGLRQILAEQPELANAGIPYDELNTMKAHPLHRICDGVMSKTFTDEQAVEMAKIFLEYDADINGGQMVEKKIPRFLLQHANHP